VAGAVKTRLIPLLGAQQAAAVYREMLQHAMCVAAGMDCDERQVWIDAAPVDPWLSDLAGKHGLAIRLQDGVDLGARMQKALSFGLSNCEGVVLIGSDCPEYDRDYLEASFEALAHHDLVIGPAADGGYVLIGCKRVEPSLFDRMPWGSSLVLDSTRQRARRLNWRWHELPVRRDVDVPDDLLPFADLRKCVT
jgi:hypothetical protein